MEREKTEIIDFSGEKFNKFTIPNWIIVIIVFSLAVLNMFSMIIFSKSQIVIYLSIALTIIFILYYCFVISNSTGKLRKFSVSSECIEVLLPNRPIFITYWSEFEKIEVKLNIIQFKPFNVYYFHFLHLNTEKKVSVSLNDFHRAKISEFLKILRKYANIMNKEFLAVKETNISGVYLIEDMEIL
ncbi:MAG: hypothetical protein ACFFG0_35060 [Candidatus Thorarchaeota archaeon]